MQFLTGGCIRLATLVESCTPLSIHLNYFYFLNLFIQGYFRYIARITLLLLRIQQLAFETLPWFGPQKSILSLRKAGPVLVNRSFIVSWVLPDALAGPVELVWG